MDPIALPLPGGGLVTEMVDCFDGQPARIGVGGGHWAEPTMRGDMVRFDYSTRTKEPER